jgi:hypothetical protein
MRPGTPEVTLFATRHIKNKPTTPNKTDQKMESRLKTEKSITPDCLPVCKWVRW